MLSSGQKVDFGLGVINFRLETVVSAACLLTTTSMLRLGLWLCGRRRQTVPGDIIIQNGCCCTH